MTARNDITGDMIQTKGSTDAYRDGWDRIFGKKNKSWTSVVQENGDELIIEIPQEALDELGWKIGDTLIWEISDDSVILRKKQIGHPTVV